MAYSDWATFYGGGLSQHPFQGVCQGNGAGPAIWLTLSLCLIHMLHQFGSPTQISSTTSLTSFAMLCFIYIDDCNLFVLAPLQTQPPECVTNSAVQPGHLARQLEATSGTLSLNKCSWSRLFYYFKAGKWKLHSSQTYPATLAICGPPTQALQAQWGCESGWHSPVPIGFWPMTAQMASLTEKSDAWASAILQGHLDWKIFWQGLHTMIWPSFCYPLAVSSISEAATAGIARKLYKALLPKLGTNQLYPTTALYNTWQQLNQNDNTNSESALTRWSKTKWQSWSEIHVTNTTMTITIGMQQRDASESPRGSRQTKVPPSCTFPMGNRSNPRVKDCT